MGRILSFIGRFTVDSTIVGLLAGVNGRKKVHKLVQKKAKGSPPPPPLLLNYKRRPRDDDGIVGDVQEIAKKVQDEAIQINQLHEQCVKSLKGTEPSEKMPREASYKESDHPASNMNRVFIRARL